jgi:hypothetical protein
LVSKLRSARAGARAGMLLAGQVPICTGAAVAAVAVRPRERTWRRGARVVAYTYIILLHQHPAWYVSRACECARPQARARWGYGMALGREGGGERGS